MRLSQEKYDFVVRWEPYLLRPQVPPGGQPRSLPDPENPMVKRLREAGKQVDIEFTGKSAVTPFTPAGHALLEYAKEHEGGSKQNDIQEALFKAFFTDGNNLDTDFLVKTGVDAGLDADTVKKVITDQQNIEKVYTQAKSWSESGVTGVPHFYMNGYSVFSGAQDADTICKVFDMVAKKEPRTLPVGGKL